MKALILNFGLGSHMNTLTAVQPKYMSKISSYETILSHQLRQIVDARINEVLIDTGHYDSALVKYCQNLDPPLHFTFVNNPVYNQSNYIYSAYCAREYLDDDIILMHGNLVLESEVFNRVFVSSVSCVTSTFLKGFQSSGCRWYGS